MMVEAGRNLWFQDPVANDTSHCMSKRLQAMHYILVLRSFHTPDRTPLLMVVFRAAQIGVRCRRRPEDGVPAGRMIDRHEGGVVIKL
jgi:hypothetical protein